MTEYPKYIRDEVVRRLNGAYKILAKQVAGEPMAFYLDRISHVALADLLLESGFKPPVDPLLKAVWEVAYIIAADNDCSLAGGFDEFCSTLDAAGLTVTVTKTGDA